MASQQVHGIVPGNESTIHDEPHIEGSQVTVRYVQRRVEGAGLRPADVVDRYGLNLAAVYAALTYYHTNPEEMRRVEGRRTRLAGKTKEMTALTPPDESS
jgi:uncharacterized protein (DUF433 family)